MLSENNSTTFKPLFNVETKRLQYLLAWKIRHIHTNPHNRTFKLSFHHNTFVNKALFLLIIFMLLFIQRCDDHTINTPEIDA